MNAAALLLGLVLHLASPLTLRVVTVMQALDPSSDAVRYWLIASDIVAVSEERFDIALLIGIASHESHFAADVDAGLRGLGGARTLWQLQRNAPRDRRTAAAEALRIARRSLHACRKNPPRQRLAAYAAGSCGRGFRRARELDGRVQRALRLLGGWG